jgi:cyclase
VTDQTRRTLIVARMAPEHATRVAELFGESDSGELPHMIGVTRRTLFQFHGLYFHLVETGGNVPARLRELRDTPQFRDLDTRLGEVIAPYDPGWREPKDAMAIPFYEWRPGNDRDEEF